MSDQPQSSFKRAGIDYWKPLQPLKSYRYLVRYTDSVKTKERVIINARCPNEALKLLFNESVKAVVTYALADKNWTAL